MTQCLYDLLWLTAERAGGELDFRAAVMQGSYNEGYVQASFGMHDGGVVRLACAGIHPTSRNTWRGTDCAKWRHRYRGGRSVTAGEGGDGASACPRT
jgi:hypothetical protein